MQCQICTKHPATIHLTEITEGVRKEMHICETCAAEQGITSQSQMSINELLGSLLAAQPSDDELFGASETTPSCPDCGFTLDRLRHDGTLGCPRDYEVFEHALAPLIARVHNGATTHCGKIPAGAPDEMKKQMKLASLRQQLEAAVRNEDYERAAQLRDEISQFE